eukprot:GHRQ01017854.1.p1 GENE.GHRQ01017854.1~~GHRQ01017854.1.p1  ORF type:complete len:137 (-),score=35.41 GHRQ01017854.1:418-828(-)
MAISEMVRGECEEVVLEAEVSNTGALTLYRSLGFIRDKHLHRWGWEQRCGRVNRLMACSTACVDDHDGVWLQDGGHRHQLAVRGTDARRAARVDQIPWPTVICSNVASSTTARTAVAQRGDALRHKSELVSNGNCY